MNLPLQALFAVLAIRRADALLAKRPVPPVTTGAMVLASARHFRLPLNYDGLWFIFLASAAVFEALLVFGGRYRDAPMPVFIVPVIATVLRFWTKDKPQRMGWEELLAGFSLAVLALADMVIEGPSNLDFIIWNVVALVLAAPVVIAAEGKRRVQRS